MSEESIARTQQLLAGIIQRTPLTPKLLGKPPFRFLHDLVMEVVASTGFMRGLYDEREAQSANIADKESKIAFLQKLIDCISLSTGKEVRAKPAKIVAGLDPDDTNQLLQVLGEYAARKHDTTAAVMQLTGRTLEVEANAIVEEESLVAPTPVATTVVPVKSSANTSAKTSGSRERLNQTTKVKTTSKSDLSTAAAAPAKAKSTSKSDLSSTAKLGTTPSTGRTGSRDKLSTTTATTAAAAKKSIVKSGRLGSTDSIGEDVMDVNNVGAASTPVAVVPSSVASGDVPAPTMERLAGPAPMLALPTLSSTMSTLPSLTTPTPAPAPVPAVARPMTAARQASIRKSRSEMEGARGASGDAPKAPQIILDSSASTAAGGEEQAYVQLQPMASLIQQESQAMIDANVAVGGAPSGDHGGLVRKILETNKSFAGEESASAAIVDPIAQHSRAKERAQLKKEMDGAREMVQAICRNTAPLAKLIDYQEEDAASMAKEMVMWQAEAKKYRALLVEETRETDRQIAPLEEQLRQMGDEAAALLEKIDEAQAQIAHGDQKMKSLMLTVVGGTALTML